MNLFIESIEGGTYIAAVGGESAERLLHDNYRDKMAFQSLSDLKEQLAGQNFDNVWLKQNTPYDEMCGSHDENQKLTIELNWR
jgi:hypothetical protein